MSLTFAARRINADFREAKIINLFPLSGAYEYWKTTGRLPIQAIGGQSRSRAASRRIGLWLRLSKWTVICSDPISSTPPVSTKRRYNFLGAALAQPQRPAAHHR